MKTASVPYKIAFVDCDNCLISSSTGEFNAALLQQLQEGGYDEIWVMTGRTISGTGRIQREAGETDWTMQLLQNVSSKLNGELGVEFKGIATPYDHLIRHASIDGMEMVVIERENDDMSVTPLVEYNGVIYELTVEPDYPRRIFLIDDQSKRVASGQLIEGVPSGEGRFLSGMDKFETGCRERPTQDARHSRLIPGNEAGYMARLSLDFDKKGQTTHLINYVMAQNLGCKLEIEYFDDNLSNLEAVTKNAQEMIASGANITLRTHKIIFTGSEDEPAALPLGEQVQAATKVVRPSPPQAASNWGMLIISALAMAIIAVVVTYIPPLLPFAMQLTPVLLPVSVAAIGLGSWKYFRIMIL
jgi:hypothetical protein